MGARQVLKKVRVRNGKRLSASTPPSSTQPTGRSCSFACCPPCEWNGMKGGRFRGTGTCKVHGGRRTRDCNDLSQRRPIKRSFCATPSPTMSPHIAGGAPPQTVNRPRPPSSRTVTSRLERVDGSKGRGLRKRSTDRKNGPNAVRAKELQLCTDGLSSYGT